MDDLEEGEVVKEYVPSNIVEAPDSIDGEDPPPAEEEDYESEEEEYIDDGETYEDDYPRD